MKILFSAFSCMPMHSSEPGVAWRAINHALQKKHEVWAVTDQWIYERNTTQYLENHPLPDFHPIFFSVLPGVIKSLRRYGTAGTAVYYHLWQHRLLRVARGLHEQVGFDVAHHITFGRYWSPAGVRSLGIPFIWGPVGAAETMPSTFRPELPLRERIFEWIRDNGRAMAQRNRGLRDTARAATIGIGVTQETCAALRALGVKRVEQLPQVALSEEEFTRYGQFPPPPPGPFRAICIGRLLHWKGFHLAIRAFALYARKEPEAELWIVNDGPFRQQLERIAAQTGVGSQVRFWGRLATYEEVLQRLAQAHVLMHPALHEAFGNVCLEALAAGRPVICLDLGGPAAQVTSETGFVAPVSNPDEAVQAMASFLIRVSADRTLLADMALKAKDRARKHFSMEAIGSAINSLYQEAVLAHITGGGLEN